MAKVGRPTIGERAMTHAERKRRTRAILASEGLIEVAIPVKLEDKTAVDQIALATGRLKSETMQLMFSLGLAEVAQAFRDAVTDMIGNTPEASVVSALSKRLGRPISIEEVKGFRDVMTDA